MGCNCANFEWPGVLLRGREHNPLCFYDEWRPDDMADVVLMISALFPDQMQVSGPLVTFSESAYKESGFSRVEKCFPIVNLSLGGPVNEGQPTRLVATSAVSAIQTFWERFREYAFEVTAGQVLGFKLAWREMPNIVMCEWIPADPKDQIQLFSGKIAHTTYYYIWARLVIFRL